MEVTRHDVKPWRQSDKDCLPSLAAECRRDRGNSVPPRLQVNGINDQTFGEGICFYDATGQRIANYPKQHSENLTTRHQSAEQWLKPMCES